MGNPNQLDLGGMTIVCTDIVLASTPGGAQTSLSATEITVLDGITAGTAAASKALVLDSSKNLAWAAGNSTKPLDLTAIVTTVGASVDGLYSTVTTAVALGTYANAFNAKLDFGSAGRVNGLGAPICGEIDLGAGCSQGTYSVFEAELIMPSGALTGTATSFMIMDLSGAAAATFDTNGAIFSINGVTLGTTKAVANNGSIGNVNEITAGLRVFINGAPYYLLMATSADFVD